MTTEEKFKVHLTFQKYLEKTKTHFPKFNTNKIYLDTNLKGRSLGKCIFNNIEETFVIKINLWYVKKYPEIFKNTCLHEIAHAVDKQLYNNLSHGRTWQMIMIELGASPKRVEDKVNIPDTRVYKYVYKCNCQKHYLSIKKHNKMKKNPRLYYCCKCHGDLKFEKEI
jgi:predicted SprT family Zn-dependent metalloprotease